MIITVADVIPRWAIHGITEISDDKYAFHSGWLVGWDTGELWAQSWDSLPGCETGWHVCEP
jgi:hypothetical protein